ncbi:malate/lactate/ureidoglycolate dehydrogenase [Alsobacter soli]|uniref:Malate/lactate/ureidoglycolate dehydrogenase n=1 Tax=Alsobacter soli TaxID=2109933 RepID=A0A2T1HWN2_9HYPH|nr:malate/lactate/ureidoglycolate dehydrogenase [Alsobacter soli]PSC06103.1 malate/lactate/ureidoglycolate dehydrogenase [Alsobacter soli]
MAEEIRIQDANLRAAVRGIFAAAGSSEREQHLAANHLVEANLRGHDSHGVGMIPAYIANFAAGEMKLNHAPKVLVDKGTLLLCDGDLGLGQTMAHDSVAMAIERAKQHGSCILSLRASHHIGRIGHWSEQCAAEGLISLHFVNVISDPSVAPFGGRAARVGTNPISIGIPRRGQEPVIVDFATSKLAVGKVRVAYNKGVDVPPGVLLDHTGEPTTSPAALFEEPRGTLLPFGDHKGWGLSLACELLAGALSGGGTQHHPRQRPAIINSMFSVIVSPEAVGTTETFFPQIDAFIEWARTPLPGRDAEVLIAGEPERRTRAARLRDGIPVDVTTWEQINGAADTVGLARAQLQALAGLA